MSRPTRLTTDLPDGGTLVSGAMELDDGARGALICADGFRVDVTIEEDTLTTAVRARGDLELELREGSPPARLEVQGAEREGLIGSVQNTLDFSLGDRRVRVLLSGERDGRTGRSRVVGQATVVPAG